MRTPLSSLNGAQGLEPCLATGCNAPLTPSVLAAAAGATGIVQQRETQVLSQNRPVPRTGPPAWRETGWFWRFAGFWSQSDENSLPSPNSPAGLSCRRWGYRYRTTTRNPSSLPESTSPPDWPPCLA